MDRRCILSFLLLHVFTLSPENRSFWCHLVRIPCRAIRTSTPAAATASARSASAGPYLAETVASSSPTAAVEPTDSESILVVTDERIHSSHTADTMTSRVRPVTRSKTDNSEIAVLPLPRGANYSPIEVFSFSLQCGRAAAVTAIDGAKKDGKHCCQKRRALNDLFPKDDKCDVFQK